MRALRIQSALSGWIHSHGAHLPHACFKGTQQWQQQREDTDQMGASKGKQPRSEDLGGPSLLTPA
jgi:hypothetical protein